MLVGLGCVVVVRWVWFGDLWVDYGFCSLEFAGILGAGWFVWVWWVLLFCGFGCFGLVLCTLNLVAGGVCDLVLLYLRPPAGLRGSGFGCDVGVSGSFGYWFWVAARCGCGIWCCRLVVVVFWGICDWLLLSGWLVCMGLGCSAWFDALGCCGMVYGVSAVLSGARLWCCCIWLSDVVLWLGLGVV